MVSDRKAQAQVGHVLSNEKTFCSPKYFVPNLAQCLDHHGLITGYTKFGGRWTKLTANLPQASKKPLPNLVNPIQIYTQCTSHEIVVGKFQKENI
nr:MAG TPA: hypothetical protein [Caudoviricetes sp.]